MVAIMGKKIDFIDTTLRDGSQSNWALGLPVGMMDAVMEDIDKVGYRSLDIPYQPLQFKKIVRDLKEDPWEMIKMIGKKAPNTVKGSMLGPGIGSFETGGSSRELSKVFYKLLSDYGCLQRAQIASSVIGAGFAPYKEWFLPFLKELGVEIDYGVCYYLGSPLHTMEFYAKKTREAVELGCDIIYLKDAGGLLDVDSVRNVLGVIRENADGRPIEIHSHCTAGMADAVYAEAMRLGVQGVHVGTPPLAEGTAQPSVFNTADNARTLGYEVNLDLDRAEFVSKRLYLMALEEGLPTHFGPQRYKVSQYIHRIPGGVISNMIHQMKEIHIENKVEEVVEECIRICADMGEPHMITPFSQFVCAKAAINVALGERYKIVIDNFISYALGNFGEESGYMQMDPNLRDEFCNLPRAGEIMEIVRNAAREDDRTVKDIRHEYGENMSDEELILRYIMRGNDEEIETMRKATLYHPFHQYACIDAPIYNLINDMSKHSKTTQVQVCFRDKSLTLKKGGVINE